MSIENESYGPKQGIPGIGKICMEKEVVEKEKTVGRNSSAKAKIYVKIVSGDHLLNLAVRRGQPILDDDIAYSIISRTSLIILVSI